MHYLGNLHNSIRTAILTMQNTTPSEVWTRGASSKSGSGTVSLTGAFTGSADAAIEVEILSSAGGGQVTAPVLAGIGNGTMSAVAVDPDVVAQTITVRLVDAGSPTQSAQIPFGPVVLRAREAGEDGNGITITVDHSGITTAATSYATRAALPAETTEVTGPEWNFGAVALLEDGSIPPAAPRIRFGDSPDVHRHYTLFRDGDQVFGFAPPLRREVPAGTPVLLVSGTRSITVAQDATTTTYTGLVTLFQALDALRADPLIEVVGTVAADLLPPRGMGAIDLAIRTAAYYDAIEREGTQYVRKAVLAPELDDGGSTQAIVVECKRADTVGAEVWGVTGTADGALADLTTGVEYAAGPITSLTVPVQTPDATQATGSISGAASLSDAAACAIVKGGVLGQNAASKTLRFVWRARTQDDCDCDSIPLNGGPLPGCLGVTITTEGGNDVGTMEDLNFALKAEVAPWEDFANRMVMRGAMISNIWVQHLDVFRSNGALVDAARTATEGMLDACVSETGIRQAWAAATVYRKGDIRVPSVLNGYQYRVTVAGTSHATTEPTWPTTIGATVAESGGPTWECYLPDAVTLFREYFVDLVAHMQRFIPEYGFIWTANVQPGNYAAFCTPTTPNGHYYERVSRPAYEVGGAGSPSEPTWPTSGGTVSDGVTTWQDRGAYWTAATAVKWGQILETYGRGAYMCVQAGTTHATTEPTWAARVTDGTVVWQRVAMYASTREVSLNAEEPDRPRADLYEGTVYESEDTIGMGDWGVANVTSYVNRIGAWYRGAYLKCGVSPNFEDADSPGTGCWQDQGGSHWWVCEQGGAYMPAFNNYYYHSYMRRNDAQGNEELVETKEFGFQICACEEYLTVGDYVDIEINVTGSSGRLAYQVGDRFTVYCIAASPLQTTGGQDGTTETTWRVTGSVNGAADDFVFDPADDATWDYSDTDFGAGTAGLQFTVTPGAIPFAPGDAFTFGVEGGTFRWRFDGGSWTTDDIEPEVELQDGLSVVFTPGPAPAFVDGDTFAFTAEAVNGVANLQQPLPELAQWDDDTIISIQGNDGAFSADILMIADHTIPEGATITLRAGDDGATWPDEWDVPWNATTITLPIDSTTREYWELEVSTGGSIRWLYLGESQRMTLAGGIVECGTLELDDRMPNGAGLRAGTGYTVTHRAISHASHRLLRDLLRHACANDDGHLGVLPNEDEPEDGQLMRFAGRLQATDALGFQPRSTDRRFIDVTFSLEPAE